MNEKLKNIWRDHKGEILIGMAVLGTIGLTILTYKTLKTKPIETTLKRGNDFWWNFENLDDAMKKFKEIEEICINIGKDEVAIFGGGGVNAGKYTVMHLS